MVPTKPRTDPLATFAGRLKAAKAISGLSQSKLAPKAGCSRTFIISIEKGRTLEVSMSLIFRLADALGVSPRWLALGEGTQTGTKGLTDEEKQLILIYRELPKPFQEHLTHTAQSLADASIPAPSPITPFPGAPKPAKNHK